MPPEHSRIRRLLGAVAGAVLVLLATAGPAAAHTDFEGSTPKDGATLPIMSTSPYPFAGNVPTGEVATHPCAPSLRWGNAPCQVLAISRPRGVPSSPHAAGPGAREPSPHHHHPVR